VGEAVAFRPDGHSDFAALRTKAGSARACLVAFDLLNLNGEDLRQRPIEERRPSSARTGARRCSSPSSGAASATCQSTPTCRFRRPGTSASTTPWPSGASRSTRTTSTSWTITRTTVRASTTIANGSTGRATTAPTGCPTTPRCGRLARPERAPGSRRWRCWAASLSWCLTNH
jgi:hypothetical protein